MPDSIEDRLNDLDRRVRILEGDFQEPPSQPTREELLGARAAFSLKEHLAGDVRLSFTPVKGGAFSGLTAADQAKIDAYVANMKVSSPEMETKTDAAILALAEPPLDKHPAPPEIQAEIDKEIADHNAAIAAQEQNAQR